MIREHVALRLFSPSYPYHHRLIRSFIGGKTITCNDGEEGVGHVVTNSSFLAFEYFFVFVNRGHLFWFFDLVLFLQRHTYRMYFFVT